MKPEYWSNPDGVNIATYKWVPARVDKIVYLVHGYADYALAYEKVVNALNAINIAVYAHEHYAHGKSGPVPVDSPARCQIPSLERAARDVIIRAEMAKEAHPGCPLFVYGHSLGGLISALVACNEPHLMDGLILEAAAFQIHPKTGKWYLILGAKILNWIMPSIKVGGLEFWSISRKTSVCDKKEEIYPLYGDVGGCTAGFAVHMINTQNDVLSRLDQIKVKALIATGTHDILTAESGSRQAHAKMSNSTLKIYQGAYHALHDELDETTAEYIDDVVAFIQS